MNDTRPKILIVEDDETLLDVLRNRFENENFEVFIAKDGAQGLQVALDKLPHVILLDIIMPKVGGLTMLKNLRSDERGKKIRVIVSTNVNDSKEVHEALSYGAHDYLVKSDWVLSDLVAIVRKQLDEPSAFVDN
ncbi:MAG TPA: response regulator [Candidatus Saccharimonadales bacterium]|nr:response regulator [Candidatus Saccharimonadales bacterium]